MTRRARAGGRKRGVSATMGVMGGMLAGVALLAGALALPGCGATTAGDTTQGMPGMRDMYPDLIFDQPMGGDLTPQQAYAASARVHDGPSGDEHPPLATLWVAQTPAAALAIAELAATGGDGGGPALALVTLQLLADPGSAGGGMSWHGTAGDLSLHETCPGASSGYCREAPGTGPANAPMPWGDEWVARDGTWGFASTFGAPLDGPPRGGSLAGVRFAAAARTSRGQPLVVVGDADQARVDAIADHLASTGTLP